MFATISLHLHAFVVTIFNGLNFSKWREQVNFNLGVLDLDLALLEEKHANITDMSNEAEKLNQKAWDKSKRLCLSFMRMTIANNIKSTLPECVIAKECLKLVEECFHSANKSLTGTLMVELVTMKYDGLRSMQQHILDMTNIAARVTTLGMKVGDSFLVQFIMNSLPPEYGPFQINYNTIKDKWDVNELASKLTQEEMRLRTQGVHSINLVGQGAGKVFKPKSKKFKKRGSAKITQVTNDDKKGKKVDKCHFCKKKGHYQKDWLKCKAWFEKKGIFNAFICFKSNLSEVPSNTWWLDSGATTHVSNTMHGFLTFHSTNLNVDFLFMGNRMKAPIEGMGTYRLVLDTICHLDRLQTLYVPSLSRNLVYVSKLDVIGFTFKIGNGCFNLFNKNDSLIGSKIHMDGLYKLKLDVNFSTSLMCVHLNIGINRSMKNENSTYLWHKCLGHISKERLQRLVKYEILPNLEFIDLGLCVDCIKGKHIKHNKKGATRSNQFLEIIHTDICGPLMFHLLIEKNILSPL